MRHGERDLTRQSLKSLDLLLEREIQKSRFKICLCLYDFQTKQWVEKNAGQTLYPASLIKLLYLLTALEQLERGILSLTDKHILTDADKYVGTTKVTGSGSLQFAEIGSSYTVAELLRLMISASDNIAANIVLDLVRPEAVSAMAARLGLTKTRGTRKMYALESSLPPNLSTARELTELLVALENKQVCGEGLKNLAVSMMLETENKQRIGRYIHNKDALVANKVGTVDHMVGDMALLYFDNRPPVALTVIISIPPLRLQVGKAIGRRVAAKTIGRFASIVVKELQK